MDIKRYRTSLRKNSLNRRKLGIFILNISAKSDDEWKKFRFTLFAAGSVIVLLLTIVAQSFLAVYSDKHYELSHEVKGLVGESREDTANFLKLNSEGTSYRFEVPNEKNEGQAVHTGRTEDAFSADFSVNADDGITVTDSATNIGVTLIPEFLTREGKKVDGNHMVYPSGANKLVYTLKYNGLKEDIIVPEFKKTELSFGFKLRLPAGAEARLDGQGNIGVYVSDPSLFGNISYGSEEDRAKVEQLRQAGQKNHLVMTVPYPIVKDASGQEYGDRAEFGLSDKREVETTENRADLPADIPRSLVTVNEYKLTLKAHKLKDLAYPISIDPTVQVSSASDFNKVVSEGGVEVDQTNGLIRRSPLTGGITGSWSGSSTFTNGRSLHTSIVAKGHLYVIGGTDGGTVTGVQYAPLNATTGAVGTFVAGTALPEHRTSASIVYANERIYIIGGSNGSVGTTTTYYIKINDDGTMGSSWTSTSNQMNSTRTSLASAYYNGYIYAVGGATQDNFAAATMRNSVEYAPILANGSVGTWIQSGNTFTTARGGHAVYAYNGYLYLAGGADASNHKSDSQYSKINSDGSIGAWVAGTTFTTGRSYSGYIVYGGHLYMMGGCITGACGSGGWTDQVIYAEIYGDGSIGAWRTTTGLTSIRGRSSSAVFNGFLYTTGGCTASNGSSCTTHNNTAEVASIQSAGTLNNSAWTTGTNINNNRERLGVVAVNGYLYAIGGCNNFGCETEFNTVSYALINSNGSLGNWSATTVLPGARASAGVTAYNGYIYVVSGCSIMTADACTTEVGTTYYAAPATNGTIASWSTDSTDPINTNRHRHTATAHNGYIYVVGDSRDVEYAQINTSDNSLNAWTNQSNALATDRFYHQAVIYRDYLYIVGGVENPSGDRLASIVYSQIGSNGVPGSFSAAASMGTARGGPIAAVSNGYMYVYGGEGTTGAPLDTAEYAIINSDGTLGTWASTTSMSVARERGSGTAYGGVLYAVGGFNTANGQLATTQYQFINSGGSGGASWLTDSSGTLATARYMHVTLAALGRIYVIGGCTSVAACLTNPTTSVESAPVNDDGTLGTWRAETALPAARGQHGGTFYNGYIYVSGGYNSSGAGATDTYYAKLNSDGTLASDPDGGGSCSTTWCAQPSFSNFQVAHKNVALNGYIYAVGGSSGDGGEAVVRYASINSSNGSLGPWSNTANLPSGRSHPGVSVHKDTIYVTGGSTTNSTFYKTTFYTAPAANGTISSWNTSSQLLSNARQTLGSIIHNGYIYVYGGWNGTALVSATEYAPILSSGEIGPWQRTVDQPEGRDGVSAAYWNGKFYSPGGNNNGTLRNTTQYASLQSIPRSGSFSKYYDFDLSVTPTKFITRGSKLSYGDIMASYANNFTCDNSAFDNVNQVASVAFGGANAQSIALGRTQARCLSIRYTIDDTDNVTYPEYGQTSYISEFDVYFHANPTRRLKGGRTFINGVDRGLNAQ